MYSEQPAKAPYLDWTLDRWKIGVIFALFIGLIVASVARPQLTQPIVLPDESVIPAVELSALEPTAAISPSERENASSASASTSPSPHSAASTAAPTAEAMDTNPLLLPPSMGGDIFRLPVTLGALGPNAFVPPGSIRVLFGTAAAGSTVKVFDQRLTRINSTDLSSGRAEDQLLGAATVSRDGLWQLTLPEALATGQHVLTIHEFNQQDELTGVSAPVVVNVLAVGEEGPMALATPVIRSPWLGARLFPGAVEFTGTGLRGVVVRLQLNDSFVAESLVTTQDTWRIVTEDVLTPGVYVARVTAMNPQGDVLAESAPVTFVVQEEPKESLLPLTLPAPTLPLTISGLAYGDRRRTTLLVNGLGTPHALVAAWLGGKPVKAANVAVNGHWLLLLDEVVFEGVALAETGVDLEVRSNFGERVRADTHLQQPLLIDQAQRPRLLSPRAGELLTTTRPLLQGMAEPMTNVAIVVNRQVVGQVQADEQGEWSFRLVTPLPSGAVILAAGWMDDVMPEQYATPIVVMVMPNHKLVARRPPLTLIQKPPAKFPLPDVDDAPHTAPYTLPVTLPE